MAGNGDSTKLYNADCTRGVGKTLPKNKVVFRIMKSLQLFKK